MLGPEARAARPSPTSDEGAAFWPLAVARELDDAILHLRVNEPELGIIVFRSEGDPDAVLAFDALLDERTPTIGWCAKSASIGSAS